MRLLFLNTACCWEGHCYPILHLSKILQENGFEILQVFERELECSYKDKNWENLCQLSKTRILQTALENNIPYCFLSDYLEEESRYDIKKNFLKIDSKNWKEQTYDDLDLFTITKGSIFRVLRKVIQEPLSSELDIIERFYNSAAYAIEAFKRLYKETNPDVIIFLNGLWYLERIAFEIAKRFNIRTFAHENSCFNDRKFFDPNGVIANRFSFAFNSLHALEAKIVKQSDKLLLQEYLKDIYKGDKNTISQTTPTEAAEIRKKLSIPNQKKIALLLGQVPYDTVMIYDSPVYNHLIDFIEDTINFFRSKKDYHLIIRLHPFEEIGNNNATLNSIIKKDIPQNISIIHSRQINTYSLMDLCDYGITITSQSGLELLSRNKPVIVLGNAFYSNKGFTHDVKDKGHYYYVLNNLSDNPCLKKDEIKKVERFLFSMIFEYLIPFDPLTKKFTDDGIDKIIQLLSHPNTSDSMNHNIGDAKTDKNSYSYNDNFIDSWGKYKNKSFFIKFYNNKSYYIKKFISRPNFYLIRLFKIIFSK